MLLLRLEAASVRCMHASMQAGRKEAGFSLSVAIAGSWVS